MRKIVWLSALALSSVSVSSNLLPRLLAECESGCEVLTARASADDTTCVFYSESMAVNNVWKENGGNSDIAGQVKPVKVIKQYYGPDCKCTVECTSNSNKLRIASVNAPPSGGNLECVEYSINKATCVKKSE